MILKLSSLALVAALATAATAQTAQSPKKPVTHHAPTSSATARAVAKPSANLADNPPNVPKVSGTPKLLYALRYVDTVIGTGAVAAPHKFYTVHYTGWLTDGTKFDSSVDRGTPITFPYGARQVIPGWDTGFNGMHIGGKRRLYIPYQLAYGESGRPPVIPAKADLIFDIEFVDMSDAPPQPKPVPTPNPEAKPATDPAAQPATDPAARPATEPATKPATETSPSGSPATDTQPKTPPHPEAL